MRNLRTSLLHACRCREGSVSLALLMCWSGPVLAAVSFWCRSSQPLAPVTGDRSSAALAALGRIDRAELLEGALQPGEGLQQLGKGSHYPFLERGGEAESPRSLPESVSKSCSKTFFCPQSSLSLAEILLLPSQTRWHCPVARFGLNIVTWTTHI